MGEGEGGGGDSPVKWRAYRSRDTATVGVATFDSVWHSVAFSCEGLICDVYINSDKVLPYGRP